MSNLWGSIRYGRMDGCFSVNVCECVCLSVCIKKLPRQCSTCSWPGTRLHDPVPLHLDPVPLHLLPVLVVFIFSSLRECCAVDPGPSFFVSVFDSTPATTTDVSSSSYPALLAFPPVDDASNADEYRISYLQVPPLVGDSSTCFGSIPVVLVPFLLLALFLPAATAAGSTMKDASSSSGFLSWLLVVVSF